MLKHYNRHELNEKLNRCYNRINWFVDSNYSEDLREIYNFEVKSYQEYMADKILKAKRDYISLGCNDTR